MEKLVVLSGAGISAESGIKTFRDMGGLWEEYDIMEVASPEGWSRNPGLVQKFYNDRRRQLIDCKPNRAHLLFVELEKYFDVEIVTQNVDDLHERAGSSKVLHLHGELRKAQSTHDPSLVYDIEGWEIKEDDRCEKGYPLRPHVVWFGEPVYAMEPATAIINEADILVVVGTSLNVYPAAGLVDFVSDSTPVYLIDPNEVMYYGSKKVNMIREKAGKGVGLLFEKLTNKKPPF